MVTDHDVVYLNERAVARGAFNRKAAAAWGVKAFYDAGIVVTVISFRPSADCCYRGCFTSTTTATAPTPAASARSRFASGRRSAGFWQPARHGPWCRRASSSAFRGRQPGVYARDIGFHFGALVPGTMSTSTIACSSWPGTSISSRCRNASRSAAHRRKCGRSASSSRLRNPCSTTHAGTCDTAVHAGLSGRGDADTTAS